MNLRIRYSIDKGKTWSEWTDATLELAIRVAQQKDHLVETEWEEITLKIARHVAHECASGDKRPVPHNAAYGARCSACDPPECPFSGLYGNTEINYITLHEQQVDIVLKDGRHIAIKSYGTDYDGNSELLLTLYDAKGRYHSGSKD